MDFVIISFLPFQEHGTFSHFVSSSVTFIDVSSCSLQRFFTSLVKCILGNFVTLGKEIAFLISFADNSVLMYNNVTEFYKGNLGFSLITSTAKKQFDFLLLYLDALLSLA